MNKVTYKNKDITAYLLGALPGAETEYFDELSFTDEKFADELSTAEKDLVDAYVNDELKGKNLEQFKSYYLASPLRREKVEFAKSFQNLARKDLARAAPVVVEEKSKSFWANLLTIPQWGFAVATLVLMLFGVWGLWENSRSKPEIGKIESNSNPPESNLNVDEKQPQQEIANQQNSNSEPETERPQIQEERAKSEQESKKQTQKQPQIAQQKRPVKQPKVSPLPNGQPEEKVIAQERKTPEPQGKGIGYASAAKIVTFVLLPPLRSSKLPTFSIPPNTYSVNAQLHLESDDYPYYRVTLQSDSQTIWLSGKLRATAKGKNKVINVSILANLLKSQIYSLQVSGIKPDGSTEIIGDYPFRTVLK